MIYKILIGTCLLILSACDTKNLDESTHTKSVEKKKIDKISSVLSKPKPLKISEDIIRTLDNKVYILLNSKEGCVISEKPLNSDIVIIYKENQKFKYDIVKPVLKKENTNCVSNLAFVTDEPNYFYEISKKSETELRGYGFELNKNQIMYDDNKVKAIDLIGDGLPNIITECFSKEGVHFNIWRGHNSEEKLLHRYTFLDMDLDSTCSDSEQIYNKGILDLK